MNPFLPVSKKDMKERGWEQLDFVLVSADAYVDHPSFGAAIIARVLESQGFQWGFWPSRIGGGRKAFWSWGSRGWLLWCPAGNIDSMVAHYTVAKRRRSEDEYSPGGKAGYRPDRPTIVYTQQLKGLFRMCRSSLGAGGLLAPVAHYDYWDDAVRPSVLVDAGADLLSYGMGENQTIQIARRLAAGEPVSALTDIRGTCYLSDIAPAIPGAVSCASFEKGGTGQSGLCPGVQNQYEEHDAVYGKAIIQKARRAVSGAESAYAAADPTGAGLGMVTAFCPLLPSFL